MLDQLERVRSLDQGRVANRPNKLHREITPTSRAVMPHKHARTRSTLTTHPKTVCQNLLIYATYIDSLYPFSFPEIHAPLYCNSTTSGLFDAECGRGVGNENVQDEDSPSPPRVRRRSSKRGAGVSTARRNSAFCLALCVSATSLVWIITRNTNGGPSGGKSWQQRGRNPLFQCIEDQLGCCKSWPSLGHAFSSE